MRIKRARQILKSFADDTRLRIINLLNQKDLTVTELCEMLNKNQSNISKHLARLRLTEVVSDKRSGLNVYYHLTKPNSRVHYELINVITTGFRDLETFKDDLERLKRFKRKTSKKAVPKREG